MTEAAQSNTEGFEFLDTGALVDGELELVVVDRRPPDAAKGYVPAYDFEMRSDGRRAGRLHLRVGWAPGLFCAGNIGYAVEEEFRGRHFAERACRLVLPLARRHGMTLLTITTEPDNIASRRTCERLGARLEEIVPVPEDHEMFGHGYRRVCRYVLDL